MDGWLDDNVHLRRNATALGSGLQGWGDIGPPERDPLILVPPAGGVDERREEGVEGLVGSTHSILRLRSH